MPPLGNVDRSVGVEGVVGHVNLIADGWMFNVDV